MDDSPAPTAEENSSSSQQVVASPPKPKPMNVLPHEALKMLEQNPGAQIIDVREDIEWNFGHIQNSQHLPMSQLTLPALEQLPKDKVLLLVCRSGSRSGIITAKLRELGYVNAYNLSGGLRALNFELPEKINVLEH